MRFDVVCYAVPLPVPHSIDGPKLHYYVRRSATALLDRHPNCFDMHLLDSFITARFPRSQAPSFA
jgi:hypothetical protein